MTAKLRLHERKAAARHERRREAGRERRDERYAYDVHRAVMAWWANAMLADNVIMNTPLLQRLMAKAG